MRVLITGSAGLIGQLLIENLKDRYQFRGLDIRPTPGIDDYLVASVTDWYAVLEATKGRHAIIHLTHVGVEWEESLQSMVGTYNVFEAAHQNGVKRIAFASKAGIFPYDVIPRSITRTADMLTRPNTYYAITKVFGEAFGDMYSSRFGIEVVSVRIGKTVARPTNPHHLSFGDCVRVFERAITAPGIAHERVFGVSASNWPLYDLDHGRRAIGYDPQDRSDVPDDQIER